MTAVGVAKPKAHGQLMTKHAIPKSKLNVAGLSSWYQAEGTSPPLQQPYQIRKVENDKITTSGTKIAEIVSARFWMGTCLDCASCTSLTICAKAVDDPTPVTRTNAPAVIFSPSRLPVSVQIVPPSTTDPIVLRTGIDSPVIMLSSTHISP
mmetsp:Transcript_110250/g.216132  ORF Transcript_110250/g.216132 Transcript_110250/m.216132 type:complete len:151 (+) Transcript_110250:1246-1698(+)